MGRFFRYDSPIMIGLGRILDFILLSIFWMICCIPIVTIVPATAALYYVMLKIARKEEIRPVLGFFHAFRDNLKQGCVLTLIFAVIVILLFVDYRIMAMQAGTIGSMLSILFLLLAVLAAAAMLYTFALQAQFSNTVFRTLKNAVLLSLMKLPSTILLLVLHSIPLWALMAAPEIVGKTLPLWLLLFPATAAYLSSLRFVKIFVPLMEAKEEANTEENIAVDAN